ncbi:MAG: histidine utilization repressor [Gammaproteobacteria bacterium]
MRKPRYQIIRDHLLDEIEGGRLRAGDRVPSENELVSRFGVSRMTARRALQDLADAGFLLRTRGLGSFVADSRPMSSMLEVRNIADEIAERGHRHSTRVLTLESVAADGELSRHFDVEPGTVIYHSVLVHRENDVPIQHEDRYVDPRIAPDYLAQDFREITPNVYLSEVAPLAEADHVVEATTAPPAVARALDIPEDAPCLRVTRRTFSRRALVTVARLTYPGNRYRLGTHLDFRPPDRRVTNNRRQET